jgi:hypothetical protein
MLKMLAINVSGAYNIDMILEKECKKCHEVMPLSDFYSAHSTKDGLMGHCKECNKILVQTYRNNVGYDKKRDHYNFQRIFNQRYAGMKGRVKGARTRKDGMPKYRIFGAKLLTKEEFMGWCNTPENMETFKKLHKDWELSNFNRFLTPTIDRINNDQEYTLDNIQWLSHVDNRLKSDK